MTIVGDLYTAAATIIFPKRTFCIISFNDPGQFWYYALMIITFILIDIDLKII